MLDRRIGAQYYTLREQIKTIEEFDETCRQVKEIGYQIVQISGCPLGAAEMKEVLDKYELKCVLTHRAFEDFLNDVDEVIEYNKILGSEVCGVGSMPPKYRKTNEGITEFIEGVKAVTPKIKAAGMYLGYHNHAFEFAKFDGKYVMDRIIEETDPETVVFIVDTYWVHVGGKNPAKFIKNLGKRAQLIHFKDIKARPDNKTEMCEVGVGNLDWDEIIEACDEAGAKWALVEQDDCMTAPMECIKTSYDFLVTKGFCQKEQSFDLNFMKL